MNRLVLVPTPAECKLIKEHLEHLAPRQPWSLAICGFGPVVAAARTMQLIKTHSPAEVWLLGIAGGLSEPTEIGSAYWFDAVACYGVGAGNGDLFRPAAALGFPQWAGEEDLPPIADQLSLSGGFGTARANLLVTVPSAAGSVADADHRRQLYPTADAEDMEGFAVAVACHLAGIPCQIARGISNVAGDRNRANWQIDKALAAVARLVVDSRLVPTRSGFTGRRRLTADKRNVSDTQTTTTDMSDDSENKVRLGISTCPNDTFAFHGLLNRLVDWRGLDFEVELLDIQQLNDRLFRHEFDVAKASFHAAALLSDRILCLTQRLGAGVWRGSPAVIRSSC